MKNAQDPVNTIDASIPWLLSAFVSLLAIYVWGNSFNWQLSHVSSYQFFPLLGLIGFSIMWSHYMTGFLGRTVLRLEDSNKALYFRITGYVVLIAILLHPGILIYKRFRDGFGLPPGSYKTFVAPGMAWVVMLGSVSLLAFLAYELKRFYGEKSWWKYIAYASDVAMLAIFYHGLRLGDQLQSGWYRYVWYFYGASLLLMLLHKYFLQIYHPKQVKQPA